MKKKKILSSLPSPGKVYYVNGEWNLTFLKGATTFSITTFGMKTLSIRDLFAILSTYSTLHSVSSAIMLSVIMSQFIYSYAECH
jgi:hypothetical protein